MFSVEQSISLEANTLHVQFTVRGINFLPNLGEKV